MVRWALVALAAAAACRGGDQNRARPSGGSAAVHAGAPPARTAPADDAARPEPVADVAQLGAISAWQAVVDRAQYLARRSQHGVVFGTLGPAVAAAPPAPAPDAGAATSAPDAGAPPPSPYRWLVDDTEGDGALAIRVKLGARAAPEGARVALGGAWALDEARHWYWQVDRVVPLSPAPPRDRDDPPAPIGHAIARGAPPAGAVPISQAKAGGVALFQLAGPPPLLPGDGWPVADRRGDPVHALLDLPGEDPSYGGLDMRAPDERWQLRRGETYWVRLGRLHHHGDDRPITVLARTVPVRVR